MSRLRKVNLPIPSGLSFTPSASGEPPPTRVTISTVSPPCHPLPLPPPPPPPPPRLPDEPAALAPCPPDDRAPDPPEHPRHPPHRPGPGHRLDPRRTLPRVDPPAQGGRPGLFARRHLQP